MRKIMAPILLFVMILISGCTYDNSNTLPSQCPYPDEPMCYHISPDSERCTETVFIRLKDYNLEKLPVSFEQIKCGTVSYANRQEIEAKIMFNGQSGKISYKGSGGGSGGDLSESTNITIFNFKTENKDLYNLITGVICDYFDECPKSKVNATELYISKISKACSNAFQECINRTFEGVDYDRTVSIIISHSTSRVIWDTGSDSEISYSVIYELNTD